MMIHDTWMRRVTWLGSVVLVLLSGAMLRAQERLAEFAYEEASDVDVDVLAYEAADAYWLGLICDPADAALRGHLKLKDTGLVVREVVADAPAGKAGIKVHDVLLAAGDKPLSRLEQLVEAVNKSEGKELALQLVREGEKTTVKVTPVKRPDRATRGKMPEDVRMWLERRGGGGEPWRWQGVGPGVITRQAFAAGPHKLPKDMSVTITKEGEQPAKIAVKQGDKKWEVTEDKLDDLPEEVRKHVRPMVRPSAIFRSAAGMPPVAGGRVAPPAGFDFDFESTGQRRLEKRVDELNKQIEQLRKAIEEMSKNKAK